MERKKKLLIKVSFLNVKIWNNLYVPGFFPIARIVSMKTSDRGVFPWDSAVIYPELEVCVEDLYGMKKTFHLHMIALYRH